MFSVSTVDKRLRNRCISCMSNNFESVAVAVGVSDVSSVFTLAAFIADDSFIVSVEDLTEFIFEFNDMLGVIIVFLIFVDDKILSLI